MAHTIEQFSAACHDILKSQNNPAGRSKVCALLQEYLKDEQFVSTYIKDETPERKVLYEDPDRKSTRLNSSHIQKSRMPSSA